MKRKLTEERTVVGYETTQWIPVKKLRPHPDAEAYGADPDDRAILEESVRKEGVLIPIVARLCDDGWYDILDGCGRYTAAVKAGHDTIPCVVADACESPTRFAAIANTMHRKATTGSRVLAYVMAYSEKVLAAIEAREISSGTCAPHEKGMARRMANLRNQIPEDLQEWTFQGIAERLKVSRKDVAYAVELMICQQDCVRPTLGMYQGQSERGQITDPEEQELLDEAFNAVLMGRLPIRRWTAAFKGKLATTGQARAATDYFQCARRGMVLLATAFEGWQEIRMLDRETVLKLLAELLADTPEDVVALLERLYKEPAKGKRP